MRWWLVVVLALFVAGVVLAGVLWSARRRVQPGPPEGQDLGAGETAEPLLGSPVTPDPTAPPTPDPTAPHTAVPAVSGTSVPVPSASKAASPERGLTPLVAVDLPPPEGMRDRWAAMAAVFAGVGHGSSDCNADGGDWYYHDGGGNWARMRRFVDGRALLVGHDHEYTQTCFAEAAVYFDEPETDLLAGAPQWWQAAVELHSRDDGEWIGWIYGWDGQIWQRAAYDVPDGFAELELPAASEARAVTLIREFAYGDDNPPDDDTGAARALIAAGPDVSAAEVAAAGPNITDPEAGSAAARGFAASGQH